MVKDEKKIRNVEELMVRVLLLASRPVLVMSAGGVNIRTGRCLKLGRFLLIWDRKYKHGGFPEGPFTQIQVPAM